MVDTVLPVTLDMHVEHIRDAVVVMIVAELKIKKRAFYNISDIKNAS